MDKRLEDAIRDFQQSRKDRELAEQALRDPQAKLQGLKDSIGTLEESLGNHLVGLPLNEAISSAQELASAKYAMDNMTPDVTTLATEYQEAIKREKEAMANLVRINLVILEGKY